MHAAIIGLAITQAAFMALAVATIVYAYRVEN